MRIVLQLLLLTFSQVRVGSGVRDPIGEIYTSYVISSAYFLYYTK
jgi:hypothetical protein